jgi:hypothetical protein
MSTATIAEALQRLDDAWGAGASGPQPARGSRAAGQETEASRMAASRAEASAIWLRTTGVNFWT